ncbi:hypothetical protein K1X45_13240 [Pseudochrobactrum sp. Wa41.01b-1]|uniref:hypothetical protein n=1 Tax=Pseudochrobactrum sp. Wa41.01b-1 TaxID=2864102 RepID=UPI001C691869|nr:hypothetical protein [Pseudochrobactrum sp. Wa41.01b-1]QYM72428.1 hypothetical protein K1X45_13240 [Pseudochrobactrum sp. Wa41.01b-1]
MTGKQRIIFLRQIVVIKQQRDNECQSTDHSQNKKPAGCNRLFYALAGNQQNDRPQTSKKQQAQGIDKSGQVISAATY